MLTTVKEIKEELRKLRSEWGRMEMFLGNVHLVDGDMSAQISKAQSRAFKECGDNLYYLIESIDETVINVESEVVKE